MTVVEKEQITLGPAVDGGIQAFSEPTPFDRVE
jgi:hypothetical protein